MMSPDKVSKRAKETASKAEESIAWLSSDKNVDKVGREKTSLIRSINRTLIKARRLEVAAKRPMCVGVFGPSQAGKSYLIEVLARPEDGPLKARFDGMDPIDFLSQINPSGEKESTGLVTRFTGAQDLGATPKGCPVRIKLLSEMDIVKILGNTFHSDGDETRENPPSADQIGDLFTQLGKAAGIRSPVSELDIIDLQDYFYKNLPASRILDSLRYWEEAQRLAPLLDTKGRALLFAPLWGGHLPFSELYLSLTECLDKLGRAESGFCPIDALVPREGSILDVATLSGLGSATDNLLTVKTAAGAQADLPRPIVAALTAELCIQSDAPPRVVSNEIDLLDFPGARSRQKVNLAEFFKERADALKETYLRGKVAYLFDRYVAEQELTSMLLCIRPSNQEVVTLPNLVEDWIASTHGSTPQRRSNQPNLLFFVMTWFDTHFVDKAGDTGQDPSLRFKNRLEASLLGFFGKAHSWPRNWTPGQPFDNCYWFRNPNYPADAIIRYDERREVEILPDKAARVKELRQGFLALEESTAHFRDPARAFDEALRLNDGGISYLAQEVTKVCDRNLKLSQISARLDDVRRELHHQLQRFYIATDIDERLRERREAYSKMYDALEDMERQKSFGTMVRLFLVNPIELTDSIFGFMRSGMAKVDSATTPVASSPSKRLKPGEQRAQAPVAVATLDREALFARAAIDGWIDRIRLLSEDPAITSAYGIAPDILKELVDEMFGLTRKVKLEEQIAGELRNYVGLERNEQSSAKIALIASTYINRMLGSLGTRNLPDAKLPLVQTQDGERPAFKRRANVFDASGLGKNPKPFADDFVSDWLTSLYKVVEDNAVSDQSGVIDIVENNKLKVILDGLDVSTAASA